MASRLQTVLSRVFHHEGGYADHPSDPGGATKYGITHLTLAAHRGVRSVSKSAVRELARAEAAEIYVTRYAAPIRFGALPIGVDYAVLDAAVNSGPARGVRWLQKAVGAKPDGKLGPVTLGLVTAADPVAVIEDMLDRREAFLRRLRTFKTFGRGWLKRTGDVRRDALADIAEAAGEDPGEFVRAILNPPDPKLPKARPRQSEGVTRTILQLHADLLPNELRSAEVTILFVRGYYSRSFGRPGNDRGVYDDALFLIWRGGFAAFNANADPSRFRRGVASLKGDQAIIYREGPHGFSRPGGPIRAFRQHSDVTVIRDQLGEDRDGNGKRFWTNLHPGGRRGTSSLGCLTVPPAQWSEFYPLALEKLAEAEQRELPVILVEYDGNNPPIPAPEPDLPAPADAPAAPAPVPADPKHSEPATSLPDPSSPRADADGGADPQQEAIVPERHSTTKPSLQSLTLRGITLAAASQLAERVGLQIGPEDWSELIEIGTQASTVIGLAVAWVGRVRKGDLV